MDVNSSLRCPALKDTVHETLETSQRLHFTFPDGNKRPATIKTHAEQNFQFSEQNEGSIRVDSGQPTLNAAGGA